MVNGIIQLSQMKRYRYSYFISLFFRETRSNDPTQITNTVWGLINQVVALKYGKGRVVVFPDSTIISNFRAFFGGTPNLLIGYMEPIFRTFSSSRNNFRILDPAALK